MSLRNAINPGMLFTIAALFNQLSQILIPVVVTRELASDEFAAYRLMWLVIGTILALGHLHIPANLSYFLPKMKDPEKRSSYVWANFFLLLVISTISTLLCSVLLTHVLDNSILADNTLLICTFVFFWSFGVLVDWVPISNDDVFWQAKISIFLTALRVAGICLAVVFFHSLYAIVVVLIGVSVLRMWLIYAYSAKHFALPKTFDKGDYKTILLYSIPFGIASAFFLMRTQIESWIVAFVFSDDQFASFSLAGAILPGLTLFNVLIVNLYFPRLSKLLGDNNHNELIQGIRNQTLSAAYITLPIILFFWFEAASVISVLFTTTYLDAALVLQILLIGIFPQLFQSSLFLRLYGLGKISMRIDSVMIPLVCVLSYAGSKLFGLPGAALGSVISLYISHTWTLRIGLKHAESSFKEVYDIATMFKLLLIAAGCIAIVQLINFDALTQYQLLILALKFSLFGIVFLAITFATKTVPPLILDAVTSQLKRFSKTNG